MRALVDPHQRIAEALGEPGLEEYIERLLEEQSTGIPIPAPDERLDGGGSGESALLLERADARFNGTVEGAFLSSRFW